MAHRVVGQVHEGDGHVGGLGCGVLLSTDTGQALFVDKHAQGVAGQHLQYTAQRAGGVLLSTDAGQDAYLSEVMQARPLLHMKAKEVALQHVRYNQ